MAAWRPTSIQRAIRTLRTSTLPIHVDTDSGEGVLKAINNPQGEQALAKDWIGTKLARLFGLPTFDIAIVNIVASDDLRLADGRRVRVGPAFISRYERGSPLGGWVQSNRTPPHVLSHLDNPGAIARLIVFDTWVLNRDRYGPDADGTKRRINRDNVWASRDDATKDGFVLKAIDHSECFTLGEDLSPKIGRIDRCRFDDVFGLFPEFRAFLDSPDTEDQRRREVEGAAADLKRIARKKVQKIVDSVPTEWNVDEASRTALVELLMERAKYVSGHVVSWIWPQSSLPFRR